MRVLVSGAGSRLGQLIAEGLKDAGHEVTAAARRPLEEGQSLMLDLTDEDAVRAAAEGHDAAILCPILSVAAPAARWLAEAGLGRLVVFSSNNAGIDQESPVYEALRQAEESLAAVDVAITILRPTMIYGYPGDGNLSKLLGFARRARMLPCAGGGQALQQPVSVDDLAAAAIGALISQPGHGPFVVAGPEAVSMKDLYGEVLVAAGASRTAVLPLPLGPLRWAASMAERLGLPLPLSTAQLARFEADKLPTAPLLPGFEPLTSLKAGLARLAEEGRGR